MNLTWAKSASVVFAGVAVAGLASPVSAAGVDAGGTYAFATDKGEEATWVVTACQDDSPSCIQVAETGNASRQPWRGTAYLSVGSWIMFVDQPDAITCDDGTVFPGRTSYAWDAVKLSGWASVHDNGFCGNDPKTLATPFTLTKLGAAEAPGPAGPPGAAESPTVAGPTELLPAELGAAG